MNIDISPLPKTFWKYYDLYRRKQISMKEFAELAGISERQLRAYLKTL